VTDVSTPEEKDTLRHATGYFSATRTTYCLVGAGASPFFLGVIYVRIREANGDFFSARSSPPIKTEKWIDNHNHNEPPSPLGFFFPPSLFFLSFPCGFFFLVFVFAVKRIFSLETTSPHDHRLSSSA